MWLTTAHRQCTESLLHSSPLVWEKTSMFAFHNIIIITCSKGNMIFSVCILSWPALPATPKQSTSHTLMGHPGAVPRISLLLERSTAMEERMTPSMQPLKSSFVTSMKSCSPGKPPKYIVSGTWEKSSAVPGDGALTTSVPIYVKQNYMISSHYHSTTHIASNPISPSS